MLWRRHRQTKTTAIVDPYDPPKIQAAAGREGVKIGEYLLTTHSHFDHAGGNEKCVQQCVQFPLLVEGSESGGFAKERRRSGRPVSARSDILIECYRRYPGIKVYGGGDKVAGLTNLVRFLLASISGQGTTENAVGSSRSRAGTGQR